MTQTTYARKKGKKIGWNAQKKNRKRWMEEKLLVFFNICNFCEKEKHQMSENNSWKNRCTDLYWCLRLMLSSCATAIATAMAVRVIVHLK